MKRRHFLAGAAMFGTSATVALYALPRYREDALEEWLHETVSDCPTPCSPDVSGQLDAAIRTRLYGLFAFIGDHWSLPATGAARDALIADLIVAKTASAPSYLHEYQKAAAIIDRIERTFGSSEIAYARLLSPEAAAPETRFTRLGRANRFVAGEFVAWFMAMDGFARYGYHNYRGFMGGSFTAKPPPCRLISPAD